jgi:selenocysteine-specific elongation factor
LAHGTPEEILLQELARGQPTAAATLVAHSTLGTDSATLTLGSLLKSGQVVPLDIEGIDLGSVPDSAKYLMSAGAWQELLERTSVLLREYHESYPLRAGMPREELKSRLRLPPRAFNEAMTGAAAQGIVVGTEATVFLANHRVTFTAEQEQAIARLLKAFQEQPYSPPSLTESEALVGAGVLSALIEQGKLTKVSDSVLFSSGAYQQMTQAIVDRIQAEGHVTLAQVRDIFATSRKYAQALLEHLDDKHVTRRVGDKRILR